MEKIKVSNMETRTGNAAANQFIIETEDGIYFQSYATIIALKKNGQVYLDKDSWDYSRTTLKYLHQFLGTSAKKEVLSRIDAGRYLLKDLN